MSKKYKCPSCGNHKYLLLSMSLRGNDLYIKSLECRTCHFNWIEKESLISKSQTYEYIWDSINKKTIPLHRWVWEQTNGRILESWEIIHHINRRKGDNRISNLLRVDTYDHSKFGYHTILWNCLQCHHSWIPRAFNKKQCPKCKSLNISNILEELK